MDKCAVGFSYSYLYILLRFCSDCNNADEVQKGFDRPFTGNFVSTLELILISFVFATFTFSPAEDNYLT